MPDDTVVIATFIKTKKPQTDVQFVAAGACYSAGRHRVEHRRNPMKNALATALLSTASSTAKSRCRLRTRRPAFVRSTTRASGATTIRNSR